MALDTSRFILPEMMWLNKNIKIGDERSHQAARELLAHCLSYKEQEQARR